MIIFGGCDTDGKVRSLNLDSFTWSTVKHLKFIKYSHTATSNTSHVYLFGGYDAQLEKDTNDLHRFSNKLLIREKIKGIG